MKLWSVLIFAMLFSGKLVHANSMKCMIGLKEYDGKYEEFNGVAMLRVSENLSETERYHTTEMLPYLEATYNIGSSFVHFDYMPEQFPLRINVRVAIDNNNIAQLRLDSNSLRVKDVRCFINE